MLGHESLVAMYKRLEDCQLLERLECYALWTIPSVFPSATNIKENGNALIEHDYQSTGALLVNRLATKLARTLFPVGTSFFRIDITDEAKERIRKELGAEADDLSFVRLEKEACDQLFRNASYAQLIQLLVLLIITGECLLLRQDDKIHIRSLRNYVLQRNHVGEVQRIIIKDCKRYYELSPDVQTFLGERKGDSKLELYTQVLKVTDERTGIVRWEVTQEIDGQALDGIKIYRDKLCPYIPVTWSYMNGDSYGRGYVEQYAGDFAKLSELSEALTRYELEALRVIHVYDPAGAFDIDSAVQANTGDFVTGQKDSVTPYEFGVYQKIQEIRNDLETLKQQLSVAFMYAGNVREGERVTAYEIQQNAQEAEQVLGGVYSYLSMGLHLPLAYILLYELDPTVINAFDKSDIKLNILTGLLALNRASENQSLIIAANEIATVFQVFSQVSKKYDLDKIVDGILLSNGIDPKSIQKSREQLEAEARQEEQAYVAQQQAIMQQGNQLQNTEAVQLAQQGMM